MSKSFFSYLLTKVYLVFHFIIRKRSSKTIFQNYDDKDFYLKNKLIREDNFEIILSSGIELKDFNLKAKRDNQEFTFICISRLILQKGILNFIEAAQIWANKNVTQWKQNTRYIHGEICNQDNLIELSYLLSGKIGKDVFDLLSLQVNGKVSLQLESWVSDRYSLLDGVSTGKSKNVG